MTPLADPIDARSSDLDLLGRVLERLEADIGSIATEALGAIADRVPALAGNEPALEQVRQGIEASLHAELLAFHRGAIPDRIPAPDAALVETLEELGDLEGLRPLYGLIQKLLWARWLDLVEDQPDLSVEQRRSLLARGPDFFFGYADLLTENVAAAIDRRRRDHREERADRRFFAVQGLLEDDASAPSLEGFDFERFHLGLIAWGQRPVDLARALASALERPLLSVNVPSRELCCWAWVSGVRPLGRREQRTLAEFELPEGGLAIGTEAEGLDGFRSTHRQASRARGLAAFRGERLVRYEEVAVEALASENREDACAFVARELRGIDDDTATSRTLRATLRAYFAADHNAASAAAALGVHQQTVANRLRAAEERLGQVSIAKRHVELEVALRLRSCLEGLTDEDP
jgi:hypothetical protein